MKLEQNLNKMKLLFRIKSEQNENNLVLKWKPIFYFSNQCLKATKSDTGASIASARTPIWSTEHAFRKHEKFQPILLKIAISKFGHAGKYFIRRNHARSIDLRAVGWWTVGVWHCRLHAIGVVVRCVLLRDVLCQAKCIEISIYIPPKTLTNWAKSV